MRFALSCLLTAFVLFIPAAQAAGAPNRGVGVTRPATVLKPNRLGISFHPSVRRLDHRHARRVRGLSVYGPFGYGSPFPYDGPAGYGYGAGYAPRPADVSFEPGLPPVPALPVSTGIRATPPAAPALYVLHAGPDRPLVSKSSVGPRAADLRAAGLPPAEEPPGAPETEAFYGPRVIHLRVPAGR
jgi:hypothetical protein